MTPLKDDEKRLAIRNAIIAEVIEGGVVNAMLARICLHASL